MNDEDDDIPELIIKALDNAYKRAVAQGHELVLIKDGQLVRMKHGKVIEVLKKKKYEKHRTK